MKQSKKIIYGLTALCAVLVVVIVVLLFKVFTPQTPSASGGGGQEPVAQEPGGGGQEPVAQASGEGGQDNVVQMPATSQNQDVGQEAAKSAALTHAGLTESQITGMKVEQDWDDGRLEYEIEFKFGGMEYDYAIDGSTGTIISCEKEIDD